MTLSDAPAVPPADLPRPSLLRRILSSDLGRGFWAIFDQGVVSLGNFATNIILAHQLAQEGSQGYGAYNILLEQILFLNSLQAALITYPMQLTGAKLEEHAFRRFATGCLLLTAIFSIPLGIVMLGVAGGVTRSVPIAVLAAAGVALWQVREQLRRSLMAQLRFADAVWGDAVGYCGQPLILLGLARVVPLSLPLVFISMGVASAAGAVVQALQIGLERFNWRELPRLGRDCWRHGRWVLAGCLTTLVTSNTFSWTLGWFYGLAEVAKWGVVGNVLKLSNPLIASITGLITPAVSRAHAQHNARAATRSALKYAAIGAVCLAPYYVVLLAAPQFAIRVFAKAQYVTPEVVTALRIFVVNYSLIYIAFVIGAVLNGLAQSRFGFYAQFINIFVTVLIALPLCMWLGVLGAVLGGLACVIVLAISSIYFLLHILRREREIAAAAHSAH